MIAWLLFSSLAQWRSTGQFGYTSRSVPEAVHGADLSRPTVACSRKNGVTGNVSCPVAWQVLNAHAQLKVLRGAGMFEILLLTTLSPTAILWPGLTSIRFFLLN